MKEGRVMAHSNQSWDEFFQDAFIKWAHSLLNNEKAKMIAFWSEYSELEKVLLQLKDNMNLLYDHFPQYYEKVYGKKVNDPVRKTFKQMQEICSKVVGLNPLKNPTVEQSIKRMVKAGQDSLYKIYIPLIFEHSLFDDADPLYFVWLDSLLEAQQIPFQFVLDEYFGMYRMDDFREDLIAQGKLQQLEKEARGPIFYHPDFDELFRDNKINYYLKSMASNVVHDMDVDDMENVLSKVPQIHYPDVVASILNHLNEEVLYIPPEFNVDIPLAIERLVRYLSGYLAKQAREHQLLLDYKKMLREYAELDQCIAFSRYIQTKEDFDGFFQEFYHAIGGVISVAIEEGGLRNRFVKDNQPEASEDFEIILPTLCEMLTTELFSQVILDLIHEDLLKVECVFEDDDE